MNRPSMLLAVCLAVGATVSIRPA
ncbi:TIGR02301 family protein, partial [Mesorhizobium sp. M7A.F.Ca.CA.001.13.1.1]